MLRTLPRASIGRKVPARSFITIGVTNGESRVEQAVIETGSGTFARAR